MDNLKIYEAVRSVPEEAKKPIRGGRLNGMTDINPMWRIKELTNQFGACGFGWYYIVTNKWTEAVDNEVCAFVDIELYIKQGDDWSKPIHGTGGSKLASKEKGGVYVSDECYKMATTDALSVACKQLGFGADVYWQGDRTKYSGNTAEKGTDAATSVVEQAKLKAKVLSHINRHYKSKEAVDSILQRYGIAEFANMTEEHCKDYEACVVAKGGTLDE